MTEILVFLSPYLFITARKRSLGQGNIFTPVCHSVHTGVPGGAPPPRTATAMGGTHTTGMHSCFFSIWI